VYKRQVELYGTDEFLNTCADSVREIYAYWLSKRTADALPAPSDIDPLDIPKHLAGVTLVDVARDPLRFTYRLVGTRECSIRGYDPTGRDVREAYIGDSAESVLGRYARIVETGEVAYFAEMNRLEKNRWMPCELVYLPLSDDGGVVTRILVFAHLEEPAD